ncbi:MAG: hypothetical protein IH991_00970 [Planctomycetes bacterium]|nr:hypothetical protein [Planctomycetota bacterium]
MHNTHHHGAYRRHFLKPGWEIRWNHDRDVKTLNDLPHRFNRRTSGNLKLDEFSELDWHGNYRYIAAIRGNKFCAACHSVGEIIGVIAVNRPAR